MYFCECGRTPLQGILSVYYKPHWQGRLKLGFLKFDLYTSIYDEYQIKLKKKEMI